MSCRGRVIYPGLQGPAGADGFSPFTLVTTEAELIAALAAQDPMIYVGADITATQDYSVTEDTEVRVGGRYNLAMGGSYNFVVTTGYIFTLSGDGRDVSSLSWNTSGAAHDLVELGSTARLVIRDLHIIESASNSNAGGFCQTLRHFQIRNARFTFQNDNYVRSPAAVDSSAVIHVENVELIGGGTSTYQKWSFSALYSGSFRNVRLLGTWSFSSFQKSIIVLFNATYNSVIENVGEINHSWNIELQANKVVNARCGGDLYVTCYDGRGLYGGNNLYLGATYTRFLTNIESANVDMSSVLQFARGLSVVNLTGGAFTPPGHYGLKLTNCAVDGGITLSASNDRCILTACTAGTIDSPGGSGTITIASGATDCIVNGCETDAAISDSGTGTQFGPNVVY